MPDTPLVEVLLLQRHAWQRGERPALETLLESHPHLASNPDAVLDLIYNEVVLREQAGETPTADDYLARFPNLANELRAQFEIDGVLTALQPTDAPPRLEGCDLLDELGRGAMGTVYRGWQRAARRPVAVKVLSDAVPAERVRNEVQAVGRLSHPHIVGVYEVKEYDGRTALVLEYVEGGNLAQKLAGKPVAPADAAHLVEQLARAMAYAHSRGVVHRDLKPSNVLLSGGPDAPLSRCEPKIGDFGLAKLTEDGRHLTRTSDILGTPSYMAPEQTGEGKDVGPLADVYALGAILYECLTGRPPFVGQGMIETLERVRHQEPVPPSRLAPGVPRDLEVIALKCLHKSPARRYDSAGALADDLRRYQAGEPIRGRPVGPLERAWKWARRRPVFALLAVGSVLAGAAVVAGSLIVGQMLRGERDVAVRQAAELERRLAQTRGLQYTAQLLRVAALRETDPAQALKRLDACPAELRCFSWAVLRDLCHPYRRSDDRGKPIVALAAAGDAVVTLEDGDVRLDGRLVGRGSGAIATDGRRVAAGGDGGVTVWDEGEVRLTVPGRAAGVAFLPDGRTLAVNAGASVALYDLRTLKLRRAFKGETSATSPVAVSPDGTALVCALRDDTVQLWDTRTGRPLTQMKGHETTVTSLAFAPDGRSLAAGAGSVVRLFNVANGAEIDSLDCGVGTAVGLAFHPTRRVIAVAGSGGEGDENRPDVQLWDVAERRGTGPLRAHGGASGVAFVDGGATLLTAGSDRTLKRWDFPGEPRRVAMRGYAGGPVASSDAAVGWVVPATRGDDVVLFDRTRAAFRTVPGRGRRLLALALPADGRFVVTGGGDETGEALVWDPQRGWPTQVLPGHPDPVVAVACSADGAHAATGDVKGVVRLWRLDGSRLLWAAELGAAPSGLALSGGVVVAAGGRCFAAWGEGGTEIKRVAFSTDAGCVALSGRLAACAGPGGVVTLIDLGGAVEELPTPLRSIASVALSGDGATLAVGGAGGAVRVWDVATRQERLALPGHRGGVTHVGFAGAALVSVSGAGELRMWYARR